MTRIDFYLLETADANGKPLAACKLVHKAFRLGHRVYLLTANAGDTQRLDDLLWTFAAGSFIPHQPLGPAADASVPVVIGHEPPPPELNDVLVSLAPEVPPYFDRFARVADIVGADDADKQQGRERFRTYRSRGYTPETHTL